MKIFISWSGQRSHAVAQLLKKWLKCVLQASKPWVSSDDIDKGSLWFTDITSTLNDCSTGIICLTNSNLNSPWILFESGALAKGLDSKRVCTFLIDVEPKDIKDPLAQFNHTIATKDSVFNLVKTINSKMGDASLEIDVLDAVFNTYWIEFETQLSEILKKTSEDNNIPTKRTDDDVLDEILFAVRGMEKRLRSLESDNRRVFNNRTNNTDHIVRKYYTETTNDNDEINEENLKIAKVVYDVIQGKGQTNKAEIVEEIKRNYQVSTSMAEHLYNIAVRNFPFLYKTLDNQIEVK